MDLGAWRQSQEIQGEFKRWTCRGDQRQFSHRPGALFLSTVRGAGGGRVSGRAPALELATLPGPVPSVSGRGLCLSPHADLAHPETGPDRYFGTRLCLLGSDYFFGKCDRAADRHSSTGGKSRCDDRPGMVAGTHHRISASTWKTLTWRLNHFERAFGDGVEEGLAVLFGQNPIVERHDNSRIGFGPDQSPDTLTELEDRFRQRELAKRIAATGFDGLDPRLNQRMVRHGKGQLGRA